MIFQTWKQLLVLVLRQVHAQCACEIGQLRGAGVRCAAADVEDSCLVLVSRQVRAHTTIRTGLCLRVQSNPIIEHCSAVRCARPILDSIRSSIHPCCTAPAHLAAVHSAVMLLKGTVGCVACAGSADWQQKTLTQLPSFALRACGKKMASGGMCRTLAG